MRKRKPDTRRAPVEIPESGYCPECLCDSDTPDVCTSCVYESRRAEIEAMYARIDAALEAGMASAKTGETVYLGSFARYADG